MDAISVPVVTVDTPLKQAWQLMQDRECASVRALKGDTYASFSAETIAEGIRQGASGFTDLADAGKDIQVLTPADFSQASSEVYSAVELKRVQRSLNRALSSFVGIPGGRTRTPPHFADRLPRILEKLNLDIAIVGVHFDVATVFSRSESGMYDFGILHGGPGRYICDCKSTHVWEPDEVKDGLCPLCNECGVTFTR